MKKLFIAIFVFLVAFVLVAGCGIQQQQAEKISEPAKTTTKQTAQETEPETEETAPEAEVEQPVVKQPSKQVAELLGKHEGRVTGLKYMYQDALNKPEEWETWVMGDKMHIKLREMDNVGGDVYVDNIYLDLSAEKAVGYCEANVYRCADPNNPVEVNFKKYYRKTPIDWVNSVTYAEREAEETLQQRTVLKLVYSEDGKDYTMWVDNYYGVPVKVWIKDGATKSEYLFEDIGFNAVDETDLEHALVTVSYN